MTKKKLYYYKIVEKDSRSKMVHYFCSERNDYINFLDKCFKYFYFNEESTLRILYKTDNKLDDYFDLKIDDYDYYASKMFSSKRKLYQDFKYELQDAKTPERVEKIIVYNFEDLEFIKKERIKELEPYRYNPIETYAKAMSFVEYCLKNN